MLFYKNVCELDIPHVGTILSLEKESFNIIDIATQLEKAY